MGNKSFNIFYKGEVLSSDKLNAAFEAVLEQSAISASAPKTAGLFRPQRLPASETVNRFEIDSEGLKVTALAVVTHSGAAFFIPQAHLAPFPPGDAAYLDAQGGLFCATTTASAPENAFPLVQRDHQDKSKFKIIAEIAAIDADAELVALDLAARKAADDWKKAIETHAVFADLSLADSADAVAMDPNLERQARLDLLIRFVRALGRRARQKFSPPNLPFAVLERGPNSNARPDVVGWMEHWVTIISDESLRSAFFGAEEWRRPSEVHPGRTRAGLREIAFDLSKIKAQEIEIASAVGFAQARWRFDEADERVFEDATQAAGMWRARLKRPHAAQKLYIWANSARPNDELRIRLISNID